MLATEPVKAISPHETCDRCIAKAAYMVKLIPGDLYFCAHHFSKYESALVDIANDIYDKDDFLETSEEQ